MRETGNTRQRKGWSKDAHESFQITTVAIAAAITIMSIPTCTVMDSKYINERRENIQTTAMESGLVQKAVPRTGSDKVDIIWVAKDETID